MGKPAKIVGIILIGGIVLIQFFQPERNKGTIDPAVDLLGVTSIPDSLATIFRNSCYDCHSDHTNYPWYSKISPVSWYLEKHIEDGKEKLNMSKFGELKKSRKIGVLADICDVIETGSMPLKSYLVIHRNARVGELEREAICGWSESEALNLMRE